MSRRNGRPGGRRVLVRGPGGAPARSSRPARSTRTAPPPEPSSPPADPDAHAEWALPASYDVFETTRLLRTGERDPTLRREPDGLWRTAHTSDGPATVRITVGDAVQAKAWGPGAERVLQDVPAWLGLDEPRWSLPAHPVTDPLLRDHPGIRGTDTRDVFEAMVVCVLQQLVSWEEAAMTWRRLCERLGRPAPGPGGLRLSPTPDAIRRAGTATLQAAGIGHQRARTLVEVARVAHGLQRAADLPTDEAMALLQTVRGIGPWTSAYVMGTRFARPEPLLRGDYNLPHTVAWAFTGRPRGTEAEMVELLAPFEGSAFRVVRLLFAGRIKAPRRGPRRPWQRHR